MDDINETPCVKQGTPLEIKIQVTLEGLGFRSIGRFLGMSHVTVLTWVRSFSAKFDARRIGGGCQGFALCPHTPNRRIVALSPKKEISFGFGGLFAENQGELLPFFVGTEQKSPPEPSGQL